MNGMSWWRIAVLAVTRIYVTAPCVMLSLIISGAVRHRSPLLLVYLGAGLLAGVALDVAGSQLAPPALKGLNAWRIWRRIWYVIFFGAMILYVLEMRAG